MRPILFFIPRLGCHHWVPDLLLAGKKIRKKLIIHTLIHAFAHTLLSVPGAMPPDRLSAT